MATSSTDVVLGCVIQIETLLKELGATDNGLRGMNERAKAIADQLPERTQRMIAELAQQRNQLVHEGIRVPNVVQFEQDAKDVIATLETLKGKRKAPEWLREAWAAVDDSPPTAPEPPKKQTPTRRLPDGMPLLLGALGVLLALALVPYLLSR